MISKRKEIYNEDIFSIIDLFNNRLNEIETKSTDDLVINNGLFLMSYAMFEDSIRELMRVILLAFPEKLEMKSCTVTRQQVGEIADVGHSIIIDNELYLLFKNGTRKQLGYLFGLITEISSKSFPEDVNIMIDKCEEISLYRNAIIHNGSKVSEELYRKCRYFKRTHKGTLRVSKDTLSDFIDVFRTLFDYIKELSNRKYRFYNEISRVEKLRNLWYRNFDSSILIFEDYWEIDYDRDLITNYKYPRCERSISSGEKVYLSFWKNQFNCEEFYIDKFMLCSINKDTIIDILKTLDETKFYYMIQEKSHSKARK